MLNEKKKSPSLLSLKNLQTYGFALLSVAALTVIFYLATAALSLQVIGILYLAPVLFCATFFGLGSGLLAGLASFVCLNYFFIAPKYTFIVKNVQDLVLLIFFLVVAALVSQSLGRLRVALELAREKEHQATHLYDLFTMLAWRNEIDTICRILAKKIIEVLPVNHVQVTLTYDTVRSPSVFNLPEHKPPENDLQPLIYPLGTSHREYGEVLVWVDEEKLPILKEELLRESVAVAAFAIEKNLKTRHECQSKVQNEVDDSKLTLLSSVSHKLRDPLEMIRHSALKLNESGQNLNPDQQDQVNTLVTQSDRLLWMITNTVEMFRIEVGDLRLHRRWFEISKIIQSATGKMQTALQTYTLIIEAGENLPLVLVDFTKLEQVLINILSNSLKYSPEQSTIRIAATTTSDEKMLVSISNQGPVLAESELNRIFQKFYQPEEPDQLSGAGLGLAICKAIIEAHDGQIWAENEDGWFAIKFRLPLTGHGVESPIYKISDTH